MPIKGWVSFTVREETAKLLNQYAEELGKSVSALLYELAPLTPKLEIVKVIEEENLKESIQQAIHALEAIIKFIEDLKGRRSRGILRREYFSHDWFIEAPPPDKRFLADAHIRRLEYLLDELQAEKEKLDRILYKISPEKPSTKRIIPLPEPVPVVSVEDGGIEEKWKIQIHNFFSEIEYCFGANFERIAKVISWLSQYRDAGLDFEQTIDLLNRVYQELLKFKEDFGISTFLDDLFEEGAEGWIIRDKHDIDYFLEQNKKKKG
ncbi:MAG: hypothetical protein ABC542_02760 [Candidatus Methanosuratincola petrocarbonis]